MTRRLLVLLSCALGAKVAVLVRLGNHPLLQPYGDIDSGVYARLAQRIAQGDFLLRGEGPVPYFVSPLYAYYLAATGVSFPVARVVQILLGTAAVGLVFLTARRLFGERAALLAGVLYALTGVVTFHEVLILQAALDPFLTALFLCALAVGLTAGSISSKVNGDVARAAGGARWGIWLAAGCAGGLLSLNRPNALLCVVAIAFALAAAPLVAPRPAVGRLSSSLSLEGISLRTFLPALALLVGGALTIAPFTLRNLLVSREFVLISSHGGLNFLVGNGPGANGVYRTIPGITPDIGGQARDSKKVAEAAKGRSLSSREISAHFGKEAFRWIAKDPGAAARLFLRKICLLLSGDEAPLNFSFAWYRERSIALKLLAVGPGLLVPLAGAGFVLALFAAGGAERRALLVWAAFVPAYVLAVAAFFVATRYRLPLLVALASLGGVAAERFPAVWRAKGRPLALAAGAAAVLAAVSLWPTGLYDGGADEEMHLVLWEIERGDEGAMRHAEAASASHPDSGLFWFRVGRSFEAAGKRGEAITALSRSHGIDPDRLGSSSLLSALLEKRGLARALAGYAALARRDLEEAVRLDPSSASTRLNLAVVLAQEGDRDRAAALARQALDLKPGYEKAEALLKALR